MLGDDQAPARIARTSYNNAHGDHDASRNYSLMDHLIRHRHTSPLEFVQFVFEIRAPLFVVRQIMRHRTASYNEVSGRYVRLAPEYWLPDHVRENTVANKQSSAESANQDVEGVRDMMSRAMETAFDTYDRLIAAGVAREQARAVLPLATYSTLYMRIDLHNLFHFLALRTAADTQAETRQFAQAMERLASARLPRAFAAWRNHYRDAVTLSADEWTCLRAGDARGESLPTASRRREYIEKTAQAVQAAQALPATPGEANRAAST